MRFDEVLPGVRRGNVARLARMLRDAGFAFLIHAGEDGQTDWRVQARIMSFMR
jgi:hypothetical protein